MSNKPTIWYRECPQIEGDYWFYGTLFERDRERGRPPQYQHVRVVKVSNGFITLIQGVLCGEFEPQGFYTRAVPPHPPQKTTHIKWGTRRRGSISEEFALCDVSGAGIKFVNKGATCPACLGIEQEIIGENR